MRRMTVAKRQTEPEIPLARMSPSPTVKRHDTTAPPAERALAPSSTSPQTGPWFAELPRKRLRQEFENDTRELEAQEA
ncbi:hypothetical protein HYQ45_008983 [Verticillium longisporum]|uniref:Uncharacterized protein n=1 Tax=Verticillium longisporum TaxID=100787 RepID=A0A8I3ANR1_VERLO|nr:hypothetical protein HYQ44_015987 [Verticillium longisporum]KAG7132689.1 hypothetical protein HYQ45_008983 [Verticillium longisporum]